MMQRIPSSCIFLTLLSLLLISVCLETVSAFCPRSTGRQRLALSRPPLAGRPDGAGVVMIPGSRQQQQQSPYQRTRKVLLYQTEKDGGGGGSIDRNLTNDWKDDDKPEPSKEGEEEGFLDSLRNWFRSEEGKEDIKIYFASLFIALIVRFTIVEPRFIPSLSMYPTFEVGDQLAVEKITKRIKPFYRNEVVVFKPPQTFRDIVEGQYGDKKRGREALIKRIVAVEGDKVEVKNGKLYINNKLQDEPWTAEDANYQFGPVIVPVDNVLVLGDNRNHSLDGHIWGFLPRKNVIGRAVFVYWPPWRLGNSGMY